MRLFRALTIIVFVFIANFLIAQGSGPGCPTCPDTGAGGVGPGAATPIDNYIILLLVLAVSFVAYFAKKYKKQIN